VVRQGRPTSGNGFESAVAYAVAKKLGYQPNQSPASRVSFNAAIQPARRSSTPI